MVAKPPASATRAVAASVGANAAGPSGRLKFRKCSASFMAPRSHGPGEGRLRVERAPPPGTPAARQGSARPGVPDEVDVGGARLRRARRRRVHRVLELEDPALGAGSGGRPGGAEPAGVAPGRERVEVRGREYGR